MASVTIKELNGLALVQDFGRFNHQHLGISVNGAADEYAFLKANMCLGNTLFNESNEKSNEHCACLEVFYGQITLTINQSCFIAITGADCMPVAVSATGKRVPIPMWRPYKLESGEQIKLSRPTKGIISYIAFQGGIQSTSFLTSRSQSVVAHQQMPLLSPIQQGQKLALAKPRSTLPEKPLALTKYDPEGFYSQSTLYLRFIPHSHWHNAPEHQQKEWLETSFLISSKSNRMAYQFSKDGDRGQAFSQLSQTLSSAVNFGTIQILPSGLPIVLMKDRQTMGGYPTLGSVFQVDLFRLCQLTPKQKVKFIPASIKQAQSQLSAFYQRFMSN